jgi:glutamyl-tRNA synthetase
MIVPIIKERLKTLKDSEKLISPFFLKLNYSEETKNNLNNDKESIKPVIDEAIAEFSGSASFDAQAIEHILKLLAEKFNMNRRKIAEIIRVAVWASKVSPPLFNAMEILGKEETLDRIRNYRDL